MNELEDILAYLKEVDEGHKTDKDGGYEHIFHLQRVLKQLSVAKREQLIDVMLNEIKNKSKNNIIYLEALVHESSNKLTSCLINLLRETNDPELKEELVFVLIRMGKNSQECQRYIMQKIEMHDASVLHIIAAMCMHDKIGFLKLTTKFFEKTPFLNSEEFEKEYRKNIPAIILNILKAKSDTLFSELIIHVSKKNKCAAESMKNLFLEDLKHPWVVKEIDQGKYSNIINSIKSIKC